MTTHDNLAVAAGLSVDPGRWLSILDDLMLRVGGRFRRVEPRRRARAFVLGLLAGLPRANCWSIAELAGDTSPAGMQNLLSRACPRPAPGTALGLLVPVGHHRDLYAVPGRRGTTGAADWPGE